MPGLRKNRAREGGAAGWSEPRRPCHPSCHPTGRWREDSPANRYGCGRHRMDAQLRGFGGVAGRYGLVREHALHLFVRSDSALDRGFRRVLPPICHPCLLDLLTDGGVRRVAVDLAHELAPVVMAHLDRHLLGAHAERE